jgi:hypothetical protein
MANTYTQIYIQLVFAPYDRMSLIPTKRSLFEWPQWEAPFRLSRVSEEHRAPLGRLDLLAAMAINIRPLRGQDPSYRPLWAKTLPIAPIIVWI